MSVEADVLLRIEQLLGGLLRATVRQELATIQKDKKLSKLFDLTGGTGSIAKISGQVGLSTGTISGVWQRWEKAGLLARDGRSYKKLVS